MTSDASLFDLPQKRDDDAAKFDQLLNRVTEINRLVGSVPYATFLENVITGAVDLTGAHGGMVLLRAVGDVDFQAGYQLDESDYGGNPETQRLVQQTIASNAPVFQSKDSLSIAVAPLAIADDVFGVVYLESPDPFAEAIRPLFISFAEQVSTTIKTAQLFQAHVSLSEQLQQTLDQRTEELHGIQTLLARAGTHGQLRHDYEQVVHESAKMRQVLAIVDRVVDSDLSVLIIGESGTGKEMIAHAVHLKGSRRDAPFVPVNCGALSPNLMESEFFGHMKGAFTGADRNKEGFFVQANGGTLFLDEIGEMPLHMQVKLLRVIQEGTVTPVGGQKAIPVDVRVISATNRDLLSMIKDRTFRDDLYYRVAVVTILLPPLRERPEDVEPLINHFLEKISLRSGDAPKKIAAPLMKRLKKYHWPGNVRELENVINYLSIFAENDLISQTPPLLHQPVNPAGPSSSLLVPYGTPLKEIEERLIQATLERSGNKKTRTAEVLQMDRVTLYRRLKKTNPEVIKSKTLA